MRNSEFLPEPADNEQMQLFDYCAPALISGKYAIKTDQHITWAEQSLNQVFSKSQAFKVEGPRFAIDGALVYGTFPPASATGQYETVLPNIVLTQRTLPWERTIDDKAPTTPPVPWVALMVFNEDEITGVFNATFGDVVHPNDASVFGPQDLKDVTALELQSSCLAVDVPVAVFSKVVPSAFDLQYLTHCREVDMAYKELRSDVKDGWFSVVISNRFPTASKRNYACLVSLEGFSNYLFGRTPIPAQYATVRMAVLATWSFTGLSAQNENFSVLMTNLNSCSLRVPDQLPQKNTEAEKLVSAAFHDGYVALNYLTRFGEQTASWYRGPLAPIIQNQADEFNKDWEQDKSFFSAEALMIYDQDTGLFDLSYSVAWQIGRLLALSDKEFSVALMNWRKQQKTYNNVRLTQKRAGKRLRGLTVSHLSATPENGEIKEQLHNYLIHGFANAIAPKNLSEKPLIMTADFSGMLNRTDQLPGLLTKKQLVEILEKGPDLRTSLRQLLFDKNKH
jgi:hypothetical protein